VKRKIAILDAARVVEFLYGHQVVHVLKSSASLHLDWSCTSGSVVF